MGVGVVRRESAVGVPLRQLFRYEWMDVTNHYKKMVCRAV
jgi:hypothetical protein